MKYLVPYLFVFLLILSCSESDSNEMEIEQEPSLSLPIITTVTVSEIMQTSVVSGGNISDDGGASITARGVCWSTSNNPTINDSKTSDGPDKGEFSSSITGLEASTDYFIRSYATNIEGTAYGNEIGFKTSTPVMVSKVYEGDLVLTSQQEINDFGAQEYTEIRGNLKVEDDNAPSSILDLTPLNSIQSITGHLAILNNQILTEIEGFTNLKTINGALELLYNDSLEKIDAFYELENLGEVLIIYNEKAIFTLTGFNKLITVNDGLGLISNNTSKMSILEAFNNIKSINGNFVLGGVKDQLNGFENLESINGALTFINSSNLLDFTFFNSLTSISGKVSVTSNSDLRSFKGMEKLTIINGLSVVLNKSLETFEGLEGVIIFNGDLIIDANNELLNLNGLQNVEKIINGGFELSQNFSIQNFIGLEKLQTIDAGLRVWRNSSLINFDGLQNLKTLGSNDCFLCLGDLEIEGNDSLENLDGLEGLDEVTTGFDGGIDILSNQNLTNLNGLRNIYKLNTSSNDLFRVNISYNNSLNDFCGLKKLEEYNASFQIIGNARDAIVLREELENCN